MNNNFVASLMSSLQKNLGDLIPSILGSLVILIIGWIIASIICAAIRRGLAALNKRSGSGSNASLELGIVKGIFWAIMIFAIFMALNNLKLAQFSGPLNATLNQAFGYLPKLIAGGVLGLVGWLVATIVKMLSTQALAATPLDKKLAVEAGTGSLSGNIGNLLFWFVFLLFIPAVLGALQMDGLLRPIQDMVQKMLSTLPNIFAAGVIGFVGLMIARILRNLTESVLTTAGVDGWSQKLGLQGGTSLSSFAGFMVFFMIMLPVLIAALNALGIDAISRPAIAMLDKIMNIIPNLIAAAALLGITYYIGRFAATSLGMLLQGLGSDELPAKLGLAATPDFKPSEIVGKLVLFFVMLFATVEAANMIGFHQIGDVITIFIKFGGQVLLGSVILMVGFWLAATTHKTILQVAGPDASAGANIARFAILGLVTAMGLRAMGLADDIVNLAFGLTLGAVAVAFALSFGLGGREAAGRQLDHWFSKLRKD